jgi:hypothetical protein
MNSLVMGLIASVITHILTGSYAADSIIAILVAGVVG